MNALRGFTSVLVLGVGMSLGLSAAAQGRGRGRERGDQHRAQERRDDHGRFSDRDRQALRRWSDDYGRDRDESGGWRDRLPPEMEARLRAGVILDPDMRRHIYPVPPSLLIMLAPPPPRYRYVIIGGRLCMIDRDYRVGDVLSLTLNF